MKILSLLLRGESPFKQHLTDELQDLGHKVNSKSVEDIKSTDYVICFNNSQIAELCKQYPRVLFLEQEKSFSRIILSADDLKFWEIESSAANIDQEQKIELWVDAIIALSQREINQFNQIQFNMPCIISDHQTDPLTDQNINSLIREEQFLANNGFNLVQLFERQAQKRPNAIAVTFQDQQQTYQQLNKRANQLARFLRKQYYTLTGKPIIADTLIPLFLNRDLNLIETILGILKTGAAYVPINPDYPDSAIREIFEDTKCALVLSQSKLQTTINQINHHSGEHVKAVFYIEDPAIRQENPNNLNLQINEDDIAYVIYTSGTTGQSKGVMIQHKSVVNLVESQIRTLKIGMDSKVMLFTRVAFDASVGIIFPTLCAGGCLYVLPKDYMSDVEQLTLFLQAHQINIISVTPSVLQDIDASKLSAIKVVEVGAEVATKSTLQPWLDKNVRIINAYGPTETSVCATSHIITHAEENTCIGQPIQNMKVYVLDETFKPIKPGEEGELYLSGLGLAQGYFNRPELTEERFIANPFYDGEDKIYCRLYKTGDLVQLSSDGTRLFFKGRNDFQVKLLGHRIELYSIDNTLSSYPNISNAVTILHEQQHNKRLITFIVSTKKVDQNAIRKYLHEKLPAYMLPNEFIVLPKIPLTLNKKIDRTKLKRIASEHIASFTQNFSTETELQTRIQAAWQSVFSMNNIGIEQDFYTLGGNSLRATALLMKLNAICREINAPDLTLAFIFKHLTIREQAEQIENNINNSNKAINYYVTHHEAIQQYPLSRQQARYFFLNQYDLQGKLSFIVPLCFKFRGDLSVNALSNAIDKLISRHTIFRHAFHQKNGQLYQIELPRKESNLLQKTLTEKEIKTDIEKSINVPFILEEGYLYRFTLYQIKNKNEYIFSFIHHHIIADGWSLALFFQELKTLYEYYCFGSKLRLNKLTVNYGDYCLWEKNALEKDMFADKKVFWKNYLKNYEAIRLKSDVSSKEKLGGNISIDFRPDTIKALHKLSEQYAVTTLHILHASLSYILYRYTGRNNITLGTLVANRFHQSCDNVFGPFINIIPLYLYINPDLTVQELFKQSQISCLQALANQEVPFDDIVALVNPDRIDADQSLVNIWLVIQDKLKDVSEFNLQGTEVDEYLINQTDAQADLVFNIYQKSEALKLVLKYAAHKFDVDYINNLVEHLQNVLISFANDPISHIAENKMLSRKQQELLLQWSNQEHQIFPVTQNLSELFETQAEKYPNKTACAYQQQQLTYRELNLLSNQLAHQIRSSYKKKHKQSMPTETHIGLYIKRGLDQIVAILAILKAGGAYVPIDPEYPQERIEYIIRDAQLPIIIQSQHLTLTGVEIEPIVLYTKLTFDTEKPCHNLDIKYSPSSAAYIIYTSGTTGQPKGVLQTHHNVIRLLHATQLQFDFNKDDIWTLFHSYVFDFSVWEIWGAFTYGGKLLIPTYMQTRDPAKFVDFCIDEKVTVLNQTPSAFYQFLNQLIQKNRTSSSLRFIIFGGDKLQTKRLAPWWTYAQQHHLSTQLINMYGITETTVHVTHKLLSPQMQSSSNIGKPISDLSTYILDENLQLVPPGVPGELFVGGEGLSPGYLNRQELTESRFIYAHLAINTDKTNLTRLYKTGDTAKWLANGELEYIGRNDFQVQVHGFRIELGEIETILNDLDMIHSSCVTIEKRNLDSGIEDTYLIAYYILEDELTASTEDIQSALKTKLPGYMMPQYFIALDEFPLTTNGKIDLKALPLVNLSTDNKNHYIAPTNELEITLCKLWAAELGVEQVGINDNFFEIGGNSILAIQLAYQMKEHLDKNFSVADLFSLKTIKNICSEFATEQRQESFTGEL